MAPHVAVPEPPLHGDLLIEMLEVFTHNILYLRRAYPFGIFQPRRMYNCVVQRSRFPPLNEYITNALQAARFLHQAGDLLKFEVVLGEADGSANSKWESYFFEIDKASAVVKNGVAGKRQSRADNAHADYERLIKFEEQMRATLLTLDGKCKNLCALPEDRLTFRIQLHTTMAGQTKLTGDEDLQDFPWIRQEDGQKQSQTVVAAIVPLAEVSGIQIYAENYASDE